MQDIVAGVAGGLMKRQLEAVQPVTKGVESSLNGGTGIVGSAVGTVESTIAGPNISHLRLTFSLQPLPMAAFEV